MEDKINNIHKMIRKIYPDAVSVKILVANDGIEVMPEYRTNVKGYSIRTITGKWIKKED